MNVTNAIRAMNGSVSSTYQLGYMNMSVEYTDGRFQFVSGSVSEYYSGANKSSVNINTGTLDLKDGENANHILGLDFPMTSESLASFEAKEARVNGSYTAGNTTLNVKEYTWVDIATISGSVFAITSDNSSWEYFLCTGGTVSAMTIAGMHGSGGLINSYSDDDKLLMFDGPQDPQAVPTPWHSEIDSIVRWGVKSISNQIDFSS